MIVNDKKFASLLDKQVKNGYALMVRDDEFQIMTSSWVLIGEMAELGRETLAVLVKHLGYVPSGCCCRVFKAKDEYMQQGMVKETFVAEKNSYDTGDAMEKARYTGLRLGSPLYQLDDKRILQVQVAAGILEDDARLGNAVGEVSVCWMDDDSCIWFRAFRPENTDERYAKWAALESVWWPEKV